MADVRDWRRARRERTRLLIEYGGLVIKAGLADLLEDDRATLLGSFLSLRDQLNGAGEDNPANLKIIWRRRGLRAFDADAAQRQAGNRKEGEASHPE